MSDMATSGANAQVFDDAIFRVGKVIAVEGRTVRVKVDKTKNLSHLIYKGQLLKNISAGSYIKISKGFSRIIGKVDGEVVTEDRPFASRPYQSGRERISRTLSVRLIGYFDGLEFERGIKELPLIDNECYLLTGDEFNRVHDFVSSNDRAIAIGTLTQEKGQEIRVGVNGLFASHIGIFGNTGSGKSYTLAKIYHELFMAYRQSGKFRKTARFFLIDFNGEYVNDDAIIDKSDKRTYSLSTKSTDGDKFPISSESVDSPVFWAIFLEATEKTQAPFLRRAIDSTYLRERVSNGDNLKRYISERILAATKQVDRNTDRGIVTAFLRELISCFGGKHESLSELVDDFQSHLAFHAVNAKYYYQDNAGPIYSESERFSQIVKAKVEALVLRPDALSPIASVRLRVVLQYFDDVIRGFANKEHLAPLIGRFSKREQDLERVLKIEEPKDDGRYLTVISLKDVNLHIRKFLPLLICKQLYDTKKNEGYSDSYFNLIIDEAHNILSEDSNRESEQWKDYRLETFEEIIKEGRKFGVFVTLASQRPSDISPTIISQLHNYFLHRLINNEDIRAVERTISYLDKVSFEALSILPTGTCVLAGMIVNVPVLVDVSAIEPAKYEPKSKTMSLHQNWQS